MASRYDSTLRSARTVLVREADYLMSLSIRTAIYVWKTPRRLKAGLLRYKRSRVTPELIAYAKVTSARLSNFAWYVLLVNVGVVVAIGAWLGNVTAIMPVTCEHRHFIADNTKSMMFLIIWESLAIIASLSSTLWPKIVAHRRSQRNWNSFPRKPIVEFGSEFEGRPKYSILNQLDFQRWGIVASLCMLGVIVYGVIVGTGHESAATVGAAWAKYVQACQPMVQT